MKVLKIANKILSGLIILCLVLAAILAVSSHLSGGTPKFFGKTLMIVLSGSMEPSIKTGSVILDEDVKEFKDLKKGDVITFRSPLQNEKIITHRITEVEQTTNSIKFITKGDNNKKADPMPVPAENVLGKYSEVTIPYLGYILSFLQSKKGIGLALIIPGLLIILLEVFSVWRILSKMDKPKETTTTV